MLKECVEQHQLTLDENHARDFIDTMLIEINKTTGIKIIGGITELSRPGFSKTLVLV